MFRGGNGVNGGTYMNKTSTATLDDIYREIKFVKKRVVEIEKHMVDIDSLLTPEDYKSLVAYQHEKKTGKLFSHQDLKKELGL